MNRKLIHKYNQISSQKLYIVQLRDDVRKIEEECLPTLWISQKTTDKLENQISSIAEVVHKKSLLKQKSANLLRKLINKEKIMHIDKKRV